jgi:hypothetical protein
VVIRRLWQTQAGDEPARSDAYANRLWRLVSPRSRDVWSPGHAGLPVVLLGWFPVLRIGTSCSTRSATTRIPTATTSGASGPSDCRSRLDSWSPIRIYDRATSTPRFRSPSEGRRGSRRASSPAKTRSCRCHARCGGARPWGDLVSAVPRCRRYRSTCPRCSDSMPAHLAPAPRSRYRTWSFLRPTRDCRCGCGYGVRRRTERVEMVDRLAGPPTTRGVGWRGRCAGAPPPRRRTSRTVAQMGAGRYALGGSGRDDA